MKGAACLQHRPAARHLNFPVRVANGDQPAATPFNDNPDSSCRESPSHESGITPKQPVKPALHGLLPGDPFRAKRIVKLGLCRSGQPIKVPAQGDEAKRGKNRQQQSKSEKRQLQTAPPWTVAECEIQAKAAMQPARRQQTDLPPLRV